MSNRKIMACEKCGRPVTVGVEAEGARCWRCCGFIGDPKGGGEKSLDMPHRRDLAECCNYSAGACIIRERGRCVVLDGQRCGWWEKAVRPGGRESGRVCAACGGDVPKRRRYCERCRKARRRTAYRRARNRIGVSDSTTHPAWTAPEAPESFVARRTPQDRPRVAAPRESVDIGAPGKGVGQESATGKIAPPGRTWRAGQRRPRPSEASSQKSGAWGGQGSLSLGDPGGPDAGEKNLGIEEDCA